MAEDEIERRGTDLRTFPILQVNKDIRQIGCEMFTGNQVYTH